MSLIQSYLPEMQLKEQNRAMWCWISALSPSSVTCYLLIFKDKLSELLGLLFMT